MTGDKEDRGAPAGGGPPGRGPGAWAGIAQALAIGTTFSGNIGGAAILGLVADHWLGSSPWGAVTGVVVGSVTAYWTMIRILRRWDDRRGGRAKER